MLEDWHKFSTALRHQTDAAQPQAISHCAIALLTEYKLKYFLQVNFNFLLFTSGKVSEEVARPKNNNKKKSKQVAMFINSLFS